MKQELYSYCLQGDINKVMDYLNNLPEATSIERIKIQYTNRFFSENPKFEYKTKDPWIRSVINAYYQYFISVMTKRENVEIAEDKLINKLNEWFPDHDDKTDLDSIEMQLEKEFNTRGFYFLGGVTPPFRGPYIWRKQEKCEYNVQIPSGMKKVTVYFMEDFIMHDWLHFATFGERAAGGWATKDGLYCVKERYSTELDKPNFLISYLAHEAQHMNDYDQFPNLGSLDLEYRAKLVELIYHPSNNDTLIQKFLSDSDTNRDHPHPYASYLVCVNLSNLLFNSTFETNPIKWKSIESEILSNTAKDLLKNHTQLLVELGNETVKSTLQSM
ncbi:hypothetical protein [Neobacillus mesonae]|uniref:Uncharacterized protein n=1 Tax=Neobacillus mesonae TaxID=1193713 RepID=A0A3Q9QZH3_9BACI|nr:hypothetical protein [Neobacillus mesonae]AZU64233.1 hypothetical protein CHR53_24995 [Neobacillus mesonae]